jgi:prepilin-type N-terminal cleavage/methylation domain-containing protein
MLNSSKMRRCIRGFSLLELMIVLVLMVSLLAIAWPNMQRPLRRTTLNEAAQVLREAIDEGRYQAITTGCPIFVQMQQGNHEVRTGSFANFANAEDEDSPLSALSNHHPTPSIPVTSSLNGLGMESSTNGKLTRTWRLPDTVVITEVNWTLDSITSEVDGDLLESNEDSIASSVSDAAIAYADANSEVAVSASGAIHEDWWLPISATGQSRDASIVLLDTSINETMTVTYASATGALEIVR